jgi:hypothetical protein
MKEAERQFKGRFASCLLKFHFLFFFLIYVRFSNQSQTLLLKGMAHTFDSVLYLLAFPDLLILNKCFYRSNFQM